VSWVLVADAVAGVLFILGALLSLIAAIGLLRFPDVLTRMHSAAKPQVLGLILITIGVGLRLRDPSVVGLLVLVVLFQLVTAPVASHMIGRAAVRGGRTRTDLLVVNDLADTRPGSDEPRGAP
jgi:multicomponent Na+:H+ antiporter subunit G